MKTECISVHDMNRICRVCMRSDQKLLLIFSEKYNVEQETIANMLSECTMYKVERDDELPQHICILCLGVVRKAFQFKRQCEDTYRHLLELLKTSNIVSALKTTIPIVVKNEAVDHSERSTQTDYAMVYPCERCDQKYFNFEALKHHRENDHKGSAIECRICSKTFMRIGYLKTHIAVFHPESDYMSHNQCHICKRQFTRREHMRRHMAVIHKIVEIDCGLPPLETNIIDGTKVSALPADACDNKLTYNNKTIDVDTTIHTKSETSEGEYETSNLDDGPPPASNNDEDEDEKPLANFLSTSPMKAFMEVLLNENTDYQRKSSIDTLEAYQKSIKRNLGASTEPQPPEYTDVFATLPVKRGRGRPRRNKSNSARKTTISVSTSTELLTDHGGKQDEYKCTQSNCTQIFQHYASFQQHIMKHHSKKQQPLNLKFTCKICMKSYSCVDNLKSHMHSRHSASKLLKCDECDKVFTHITHYKRHQEAKHSEKSFKCMVCSKGFTTKLYLQRHETVHDRKRFICKECAESFASKDELNVHIKSEGHDKPMLCPECGLRCKTSNILMVHMRRHNGEKPFKCKFCSKGFPRMDDLRVHEKYHTGEKSHFCETCGKGFQRKYNLTIHLRVHTGEKPYKCPHCPQAFAQGNDLKAHIRRHTGERFRCEICGAAFLQGYQIRQHRLTEHGIKEDPPTQRVAKFTSPEEQEQQIKQNLQKELAKAMDNTIEFENEISFHAKTVPAEDTAVAVVKQSTPLLDLSVSNCIINLPETMQDYINF